MHVSMSGEVCITISTHRDVLGGAQAVGWVASLALSNKLIPNSLQGLASQRFS